MIGDQVGLVEVKINIRTDMLLHTEDRPNGFQGSGVPSQEWSFELSIPKNPNGRRSDQ